MMNTRRLMSIATGFLMLGTLLGSQAAKAAPAAAGVTVIVNDYADNPLSPLDAPQCQTAQGGSYCSLRAAVMFANRHGGGTVILPARTSGYYVNTAPAGADDDASGDINITQDLAIVGEGSLSTSILGNGTVRLLKIEAGIKVSISGVSLLGGNSENIMGDQAGGAIYNLGTLTLNEGTVAYSTANTAGGVFNHLGTITLNNSTISHNVSRNYGGGLWNYGGSVTLNNSTISDNKAEGQSLGGGGGIYSSGTLNVNNSTVSGNKALGGSGGGILHSGTATTVLRNATILLNQAVHGQGIYMSGAGLRLGNTIVAENSSTVAGNRDDCNGTVQSDGYNIIGVEMCTGLTGTDLRGGLNSPFDPMLDYLLHFGGGTATHAIKPGSPAIDGGNPNGCTDHLGNPLGTDQRGYFRPGSGPNQRCDIGAYEYGSVGGDVDGDGDVDNGDWTVAQSRWHGSWLAWDADANSLFSIHDLMRLRSCLDLRNTNGLVSLWKAEDNFDDALCRNHAWQRGGVQAGPGQVRHAFAFNGTSDYLLVPDSASLKPAQVTLEAWVRHNGSPGTIVYIADKSPGVAAASYALYTGGDGGMYFYVYNPAAPGNSTSPGAGTFLWDGNWHHVAGTYDGATVRLYVDGSQIGTGTPNASGIGYAQPNDNFYLGVYGGANGQGFGAYTGDLDEAAVWSRALSASEVCQRALKSACP